jgi:hypothetical protein
MSRALLKYFWSQFKNKCRRPYLDVVLSDNADGAE